jgi:DNA-binding HxlR family transcriptional regulator
MNGQSKRRCDGVCDAFQRAMDLLGKPWNGLLVAALSEAGPLRFSELQERFSGLSDRVLTERLKELEKAGLIVRERADIAADARSPKSPGKTVYRYALRPQSAAAFLRVREAVSSWAGTFGCAR